MIIASPSTMLLHHSYTSISSVQLIHYEALFPISWLSFIIILANLFSYCYAISNSNINHDDLNTNSEYISNYSIHIIIPLKKERDTLSNVSH